MFANDRGHLPDNEGQSHEKVDDGQRQKQKAMPPVEPVPRAQGNHGTSGVQESITQVDRPSAESQSGGLPERQMGVSHTGQSEAPADRNRRCIQAGEVPDAQQPGESMENCGAKALSQDARDRDLGGKLHSIDFTARPGEQGGMVSHSRGGGKGQVQDSGYRDLGYFESAPARPQGE